MDLEKHSPRYAQSKLNTGRGKPKMTSAEMRVVARWWNSNHTIPGNSVPGLDANIQNYPVSALVSTYERLFGKKPHLTWDTHTLRVKLLVLNAAIEDADARCQATP